MEVKLCEICHENWLNCLELDVTQEQKRFVNPNIFSLAEAYVHSDACPADARKYYRCLPYLICEGEVPVGFAMISYERESDWDGKPAYEIYRIMIDQRYQGRGLGKKALQKLLELVRERPCGEAEWVWAQLHPENKASLKVFRSMGFSVRDEDEEDGILTRKKIET